MKVQQKIVLVGDPRVGKTSLRRRYLGDQFRENYYMTLGVEFSVHRKDNVTTQIWDVGGQPGFRKIREGYYAGTTHILFVFDLSRPETIHSFSRWWEEVVCNTKTDPKLIVIANKQDLVTEQQKSKIRRMVDSVVKVDNLYIETSAKFALNIDFIFDQILPLTP